jgi:hypothetical protein
MVAHVARTLRRAPRRVAAVTTGALPAAVALAASVVVLTVGAALAGPALVREHPNGATLALLGMGVPVHWSALSGRVAGSVALGDYPVLLIASAVVAAATFIIGWRLVRRRSSDPTFRAVAASALWFGALATGAALVVSHSRPLALRGVHVDVAVPVAYTFAVATLWGLLGTAAGVVVAQSIGRRHHVRRSAWTVRGSGAAAVAGAVTLMTLSACGGGAAATTAAHERGRPDPIATTSTTVAPPTTTAPPAAGLGTASGTHTTAARAGRATATIGASASSPASSAARAGWAPATPGSYRYATSGSTSSLLGKQAAPSTTYLVVDSPSGTKQHSLRQLIAANGDGFVIDQILDYQAAGVAVVRQRLSMTQRGDKTVRTLNAAPPTVVIPFGAPSGAHHEFNLTGASISGHEVVDLVDGGNASVGGQPVGTVLVRTVLSVSGAVSGTIKLDQWWSPSSRVPVKEELSGTMKSGLVTVKTSYTATLNSLTPS